MADLLPLFINRSHNDFNTAMYRHPSYTDRLANPYNNLVIKAPRIMAAEDVRERFVDVAMRVYQAFSTTSEQKTNHLDLANKLLALRLHGAISLQKFNPLHLLIRSVCEEQSLSCTYGPLDNILSDLATDSGAVGQFDVFKIDTPTGLVIANALYVNDYGGLDKAKEWSARGRSFLYRWEQDGIRPAPVRMVFIADGPWKHEALERLRRGGWELCRPGEFGKRLRAISRGHQS